MEFSSERSGQEQDLLNQRTMAEASDLVTWENAEQQGGSLSEQEAENKKTYLAKLQKYAS